MRATARAEEGTAAAVCCAKPLLSDFSTAFVISSANNGMLSCARLCPVECCPGSALLPATRPIMDAISRSPIGGEQLRRADRSRAVGLGPLRDDQQRAERSDSVHGTADEVDPMDVLEDHQYRIGSGECLDLWSAVLQCFLSPLLLGLALDWDNGHRSAATAKTAAS